MTASPEIPPPGRTESRWPTRRLLVAFVAVPLLIIGGAVAASLTAQVPCACLPPATPDVTSPAEGVVIDVDAAGLDDVRGFTLRTSGGFAFDFVLGTLENPTEFPPGHLAEHQATSLPIRVYFRAEGGQHVVYRLEDAEAPR